MEMNEIIQNRNTDDFDRIMKMVENLKKKPEMLTEIKPRKYDPASSIIPTTTVRTCSSIEGTIVFKEETRENQLQLND